LNVMVRHPPDPPLQLCWVWVGFNSALLEVTLDSETEFTAHHDFAEEPFEDEDTVALIANF